MVGCYPLKVIILVRIQAPQPTQKIRFKADFLSVKKFYKLAYFRTAR